MTATALKEAWAAIIIQKHCRGYLVRNLYQLIRVATITIQAYTRGFLARRRYRKVRLSWTQVSQGSCYFLPIVVLMVFLHEDFPREQGFILWDVNVCSYMSALGEMCLLFPV